MVDRLAPASLMLMAILWGSTFFVLKDMLTRIDASDLLAVRFTIAALVLVALLHRRLRIAEHRAVRRRRSHLEVIPDALPEGR